MPPVGRPRTRTAVGTAAPTTQVGVPYNLIVGTGGVTGAGLALAQSPASAWSMYQDEWEYVPELRWPNNVWLFDQMRTDEQLAGLLTATMWGITQLRYVLDSNGADNKMVTEISEDLNIPIMGQDSQPRRRMKKRFSHSKHVFQALLAALYGHMYFEQLGEIVDGKWRLRKLFPVMPHTIRQILVAPDGGLVGIQQWARTQMGLEPDIINVDRLAGFIFQQEGSSWTGRSMIRDCYKPWLLKDRNQRVEAVNHERAGGIPLAEAPMGSTEDDVASLQKMMQSIRVGDTAGGAVPYGTKVTIAKGDGGDINNTIKRLDEAMARRFLLQLMNLAQGGQHVGSYALGETFMDTFLIGQRVIAQWYCDTMTEHVIEDWVDWNYGPDTELTPRITWERSTEDSLGADQLALMVQRGIVTMDEELENAVRYKYMLPKKTEPRPEVTPGGPIQPALNRQTTQTQQSEETGSGVKEEPTTPPAPTATSKAGFEGQVLPPPEDPAPVRASIWDRIWRKKPDVMASSPPNLVTVANVPILEAGVEYNISTGKTTFTPEDLADAVCAANEDPSIPSPRLKLGHIDPRYNDSKVFDGSPSFGMAKNLRLSDNGMAVYADYVGVPKWLAEILPTAFPNRSVEGYWGVESKAGGKWRFVLSACALLGVVWPGINQLEDLPQLASYYGETMPSDVQIVEASEESTGGDPMPTAASANLDDVRRAFYTSYVPTNQDARWWWIRAVLTDPNELVVEDDESGQLYKLSFVSDDQGAVSFGESQPVRIDYIPDTRDAQKAAAAHVAATLEIGRMVAASWTSREDSVLPVNASGGAMDPKEVRRRLGLPEDASDEQVQEKLVAGHPALQGEDPAVTPPGTAPHDPSATGGNRPVSTGMPEPSPDNAQPDPNHQLDPTAAAQGGGTAVPPGMQLIDAATLEQLKVGASAALEERSSRLQREREQLVAAAIGDGRIAPASREHWTKTLAEADRIGDPGMRQALETLPAGLIPMEHRQLATASAATGEAGPQVVVDDETVKEWTQTWFPEIRRSRQREAAVAAGAAPSTRISADANYRR